jgi:phytanoyl-CoA hydroxylase
VTNATAAEDELYVRELLELRAPRRERAIRPKVIRVEKSDELSTSREKAPVPRHAHATVLEPDVGDRRARRSDDPLGIVGRAVVDDHDLDVVVALSVDARDRVAYETRAIEGRHDDADEIAVSHGRRTVAEIGGSGQLPHFWGLGESRPAGIIHNMIGGTLAKAFVYRVARPLRDAGLLARPVGFPKPARSAAERRRLYERDGFVLGTRLLDEARLATLRTEFDRLFALRESGGGSVRCRSVELTGTVYHCVYDLGRQSAEFDRLVRDPALIAMLAELTGEKRYRVLLDQVQFKPPEIGGLNGWHRDMPTFPLIRPYTAITAWIALDDATEASGCMRLVPESHRWGDAWDIATDWGIPRLPEVYAGHRVRVQASPVPAGYVHFHSDLVWHSSGENRTRRPRRAFAIHYIDADARHSAHALSEFRDLPLGAPMSLVLPVAVTVES